MDFEGEKVRPICSFVWAHNFWITSHSKRNLEQMPRGLIEEAGKWDLVPMPASLWWTSTYQPEERSDLSIDTKSGSHRFPSVEKFKILGCAMNRQEQTHDAIEKQCNLQTRSIGKTFLKYRTNDIPWKIKCRRLVNHVLLYSPSGVRLGHGPSRPSKGSKNGNRRQCFVFSVHKKKRRGSSTPSFVVLMCFRSALRRCTERHPGRAGRR